jgi:hypothetical protein
MKESPARMGECERGHEVALVAAALGRRRLATVRRKAQRVDPSAIDDERLAYGMALARANHRLLGLPIVVPERLRDVKTT